MNGTRDLLEFIAQQQAQARAYAQRIQDDYEKLEALCQELDHAYSDSDDLTVGFRVGHYAPERQEIQFYSVPEARIAALREALDQVDIDNDNGLMAKYELYQSYIVDDIYLILVRPRLTN